MQSQLFDVISHLGWSSLTIVTDSMLNEDLIQNLSGRGVQHVLVSGSEALSGDWLHQVVRTGVDSWQPLHFVLMCSVSCIVSTLTQASKLDKELGTLSAFPLTSRWLVVIVGSDSFLDLLQVTDITMENAAVIDFCGPSCNVRRKLTGPTDLRTPMISLLNTTPEGRTWRPVYNCHVSVFTSTKPSVPARKEDSLNYSGCVLFPYTRRGYNGRRLRVVVKEWMSYLNSRQENGTKVWYGLLMDVLQEAATVLNFSYDLVDASEEPWGSGTAKDPEFGTFYGHVIRKEVDLGLAPTDMIWHRTQLMDFSNVLAFSSVVMVYRQPSSEALQGLLSVVSPSLLACIGGALASVTLIIVCLDVTCAWSKRNVVQVQKDGFGGQRSIKGDRDQKHDRNQRRDDRGQKDARRRNTLTEISHDETAETSQDAGLLSWGSTLSNVLLSVWAALLSKSTEMEVTSHPSRMLMWSWRMLSMVLAAAYSGTLTAFLSSSQQPLLFSRPQDLLTKTHTYTWGTIHDNSVSIFLETSQDPVSREIWSAIQRFGLTDPEVLTTNSSVMVSKVRQESFVLIMDHIAALDLFRMYDDVIIVNTDIRSVMLGVVLPKGSSLAAPLSDVIHDFQSSGLLSQWTDKWFPRSASTPTPPGPMVIFLPHVLDVLLVLPVGAGLALGAMTLETLYVRWKKTSFSQTVVTL